MPTPKPTDPTASTVPEDSTGATTLPGPDEAVAAAVAGDAESPRDVATLNSELLNTANGDASIWGAEFGRFLADLTGSHIDDASLTTIFGAYGQQVQRNAYHQAALAVANSPIANTGQDGATLVKQMDLRADIAEFLLGAIG